MLSTCLKISFASVFSCLALLLGLFSLTMGTALAHSTRNIHPVISVDSEHVSATSTCVVTNLSGSGFTPSQKGHHNHARLSASDTKSDQLSVDPDSVRVDGGGNFSAAVNICGLSLQLTNPGSRPCADCGLPTLSFHAEILVTADDEATGDTSEPASFELSF